MPDIWVPNLSELATVDDRLYNSSVYLFLRVVTLIHLGVYS